jgi:hypothetical protein
MEGTNHSVQAVHNPSCETCWITWRLLARHVASDDWVLIIRSNSSHHPVLPMIRETRLVNTLLMIVSRHRSIGNAVVIEVYYGQACARITDNFAGESIHTDLVMDHTLEDCPVKDFQMLKSSCAGMDIIISEAAAVRALALD